jgi:hypothetical protein
MNLDISLKFLSPRARNTPRRPELGFVPRPGSRLDASLDVRMRLILGSWRRQPPVRDHQRIP